MNFKYSSQPVNSGFKMMGADGTERDICPNAECVGVADAPDFKFEIDHKEAFPGSLSGVAIEPTNNFPVVNYEVPEVVHQRVKKGELKGVSALIDAVEIDEHTGRITKYKLNGLSLQFNEAPVCPSGFCPTTFKGGKKNMTDEDKPKDTDNVEDTTEGTDDAAADAGKDEKPKKTAPKRKVAAPKKDEEPEATEPTVKPDSEAVIKLIRELEDTKKKLADQDKILAGVEKRRRDELMALIPEDQRKLAKDLELSALETVTSILGGVRPAAAAGADKGKIVEAGGVETIDQKPKDEKNKDEPNMEELLKYENFFDRSKVLKSLQK